MTKNNEIVAEALNSSGLKQKEFAERIGISRSHLSMIVAGSGKASDALTELVRLKFPKDDAGSTPINQTTTNDLRKESDEMYRLKFEDAQQRIITLLEEKDSLRDENAELRRIMADGGLEKKDGKQRKSQ